MAGYWYDDDDFFLRLWKTGLDFAFVDEIHGTHLDHPRNELETAVGQAGIRKNAATMFKKHGTTNPWPTLQKITNYGTGITTFRPWTSKYVT